MPNSNFEKKDSCKVIVHLITGDLHTAFVFLKPEQRLQDLINDGRTFLPIYFMYQKGPVGYKCLNINKDHILSIEEFEMKDEKKESIDS